MVTSLPNSPAIPGSNPSDPLLVVLVGPTASGKTSLALTLAREFNAEIVSCDSVAVYRQLEIGTAKPSLAERAGIPHHLIDIVSPDQPFTAGDYSRLARTAIREITARKRLPIVAGGTGLYLRALTDGLFSGPARSPDLRARLNRSAARFGATWLHRILLRLDPPAAALIHPNDTPKLIRAIEVCLSASQPITEAWKAGRDPITGYRILRLALDPERAALYQRINRRAAAMFDGGPHHSLGHGIVAETSHLVSLYGYDCRPLQSLGYRQACQFLRGELTLPEAISRAQQGHRNYAKRQMSWFRSDWFRGTLPLHWFRGFGDDPAIQHSALNQVRAALTDEPALP